MADEPEVERESKLQRVAELGDDDSVAVGSADGLVWRSWGGDGGCRGGMYDGAEIHLNSHFVIRGDQGVRGAEGRVPWASSPHSASGGTKSKVGS